MQRMSKQLLVISILASFLFISFDFVYAANQEKADTPAERVVEQQLGQLNASEIEQFWENVYREYDGFLPESQPRNISDFFRSEHLFTSDMLSGFVAYFFHEVKVNLHLLAVIILLTVFSMILEHIQSAFEQTGVSKVAYAVTYLVILVLAMNSFTTAIGYAYEAISGMVNFMVAIVPIILALMASMGNVTSVSLFHPLIIFLVNTSGILIKTVIFPLLFFSALIGIISAFSEEYRLSQLSNLFRNVSIGLLAAFLTVFLGVISVQGATSAVVDGVTIKTAKYLAGNFVPVVGRMFTDAADTVIGASMLVKNTVGLAGVFILIVICVFPAIKILVIAFIFNLAAALMQPLGNTSVVECLTIIGKSMVYVFAALATVCLMFFLAITIIIAAGNLSLMVR